MGGPGSDAYVRLPAVTSGSVPRTVAPDPKVTVPVGVPDPGAAAATMALIASDSPRAGAQSDGPATIVVAARARRRA